MGSLLKTAGGVIGTIVGGPVGGAIGSGIGGLIGGNDEAKQTQQAGAAAADAANQGFNYLKGSPLGTAYLPQGAAANTAISGLLGVGGDPNAASKAFQNYLGSTGYGFQLKSGSDALTGSAAASHLLDSGATGKALTQFGQNIGAGYFQNYLEGLRSLSGAGLTAGSAIGGAGSQGGATAANAIYNANTAAAAQNTATNNQASGVFTNAIGQIFNGNRGGKGPKSIFNFGGYDGGSDYTNYFDRGA